VLPFNVSFLSMLALIGESGSWQRVYLYFHVRSEKNTRGCGIVCDFSQ